MTLDSGNVDADTRGGSVASNNTGIIENVDFRAFRLYVFGTLGNRANIII